jgi:hypothetical protein
VVTLKEYVFEKNGITRATARPTNHVPEYVCSRGIFIAYEANNCREFGVSFSPAVELVLFRSRVSNS